MRKRNSLADVVARLALVLLAASCRSPVDLWHQGFPEFDITTGSHPAMDRFNGSLNQSGMTIAKGFDPTNPHLGSTIIATFFWLGATNIITDVSDHLINGTPVGNAYHLVDYVTADGISMATYVATNVQNFPDPNPTMETTLVVGATLSEPVADGGVLLSTYDGVEPVYEQALGSYRSATGAGSSTTTAAAGAIAAEAGSLVYGVTLSNGVIGIEGPADFTNLGTMSDASLKGSGDYAVQTSADSTNPQWTWFFQSPSSWVATVLELKRAPGQTLILNGTLNEAGSLLEQWFGPTNPHNGDAIVATFVWLGSTNIITAVTDRLSNGTPVGNTYHLVEYVTADSISMATYVATNVRNFPDPNPSDGEVLVVAASLSEPVTDGGVMVSAYTGVEPSYVQALGAHQSAVGSGSDVTTAGTGIIPVEAGALVYGVTLSNGVMGVTGPDGFLNITTMSDAALKADGQYAIRTGAGTVDLQWTWYFNAPSTWLATGLSLNAH